MSKKTASRPAKGVNPSIFLSSMRVMAALDFGALGMD
jgi:hypothetical protein